MTSGHVPLSGSDRQPLPGARWVAAADPDEQLTVTVYVRRDPGAGELPDPVAQALVPPTRRVVLDDDAFAQQYGAASVDLDKVRTFAAAHGLNVVAVNPAARSVRLAGTVAAMSDAFHVDLGRYEYARGRSYRGREGAVNVPRELDGIVEAVLGLDNRPLGHSRRVPAAHAAIPLTPEAAAPAGLPPNTYLPPQLGSLYDYPAGTDGTGQTVAILAFNDPQSKGGYNRTSVDTYFTQVLGQKAPEITDVVVLGPGNLPGDDGQAGEQSGDSSGEIMLDIQVVGGLAPGAKIVMYFTEFTEQGWTDAINAIVTDTAHKPTIVSCSYGNPEDATGSAWTRMAITRVDATFAAAAAKGITICCASGDDGSRDQASDSRAHADFPASSPHVLGVGGTKLLASGSTITSETVWDEPNGGATGGGISALFPVPSWQAGAHVPKSANRPHRRGRGVPDVSADADPNTGVVIITLDGQHLSVIGGTSAAAPQWAALLARINQALGAPVGFVNPLLYTKLNPARALRDITSGSNGAYKSGPGWDANTGWGSPGGTTLLDAFRSLG
jgi:kumamolisin